MFSTIERKCARNHAYREKWLVGRS